MLTSDFFFIDPSLIDIDRESRQRKVITIDDMIPSVRRIGIMNPIVVEPLASGRYRLKAGERRLTTAIHLKLPEVPVRLTTSALSEVESQILELDENIAREDLSWQDRADASWRIHLIFVAQHGEDWTETRTAQALGKVERTFRRYCALGEAMAGASPDLRACDQLSKAETILDRRMTRATDEALNRVLETEQEVSPQPTVSTPTLSQEAANSIIGGRDFAEIELKALSEVLDVEAITKHALPWAAPRHPHSILCADALEFFASYSGPKFNFLHVDFPYGVALGPQANQDSFDGGGYESSPEIYFALLDGLTAAWSRLVMPSSHMMFWFSFNFYDETVSRLNSIPGMWLNPTPAVWHKTDNRGIMPDPRRMPRNIYEPALLCSTGGRFLVQPKANTYGAPTAKGDAIHTNEKPEPMLRHFLSMFVDEHTLMLDPTCGSGSAVRVAEELGAEASLGLEFNPEFAARSSEKLISARRLRAAAK